MRLPALFLLLTSAMTLGAGCRAPSVADFNLFPKDLAATELDLGAGATLQLQESSLTPLNLGNKAPVRAVEIDAWQAGDQVALTWSEYFERETTASIEARAAAERATGVGEEAHIPEPVYETIARDGSLQTDALDNGQRILLPVAWPESAHDLSGKDNTLIWLSRAQYDELVNTRHTHLEIGSLDARLQDAEQAVEVLKNVIDKIRGVEPNIEVTEQDVTEITADIEWGKYTVMYQGEKVRVQTLQAENKFASYTVLANPDNPLILEVELKAWAYGTEALGVISDDLEISGYSIIQIDPASADQSAHPVPDNTDAP
jgi:hypothetical protein